MNNKQSPFLIFTVLIGLIVAGFGFFLVFASFGRFFFILPVIIIVGMVVFFLYVANQLTSGALEQKATLTTKCTVCQQIIPANADFCPKCGEKQIEEIICEYCGHNNPFENETCENCNALLK